MIIEIIENIINEIHLRKPAHIFGRTCHMETEAIVSAAAAFRPLCP